MIRTTSGVVMEPTIDREAAIAAIASTRPSSTSGTLTAAAVDAARRLATVADGRRQLVVMTGDASDLLQTSEILLASLTAAHAPRFASCRWRHGRPASSTAPTTADGAAAAVGWGSERRAAGRRRPEHDVRRAYLLRATMPAPGAVTVRLTVDGRSYEATIPDVGVAPTTISTTSTDVDHVDDGRRRHGPRNRRRPPTMGVRSTTRRGSSTPIVGPVSPSSRIALHRRRDRRAAQTQPAPSRRAFSATRRSTASRRPATPGGGDPPGRVGE